MRFAAAPPADARVTLFGMFGTGNHGNEASLAAALVQLRRVAPTVAPLVVCPAPDTVSRHHGVEATHVRPAWAPADASRRVRALRSPVSEIRRWYVAFQTMRSADLMVIPGTGILDDFGVTPWSLPYDLFRWALCARLARCPVVLLSIGAGPIKNRISRRLFRAVARLATTCSFRDETSLAFMRSIGRDVRADSVNADLVFCLPRPDRQSAAGVARRSGATDRIGLGVMSYYGWTNERASGDLIFHTYASKLVDFIVAMLERGYGIRLLVGESTDADAVGHVERTLAERFGTNPRPDVEYVPTSDLAGLMTEICDTDCVVTSRYHNVVGALMASCPAVSLGYAEKNRDLLRRVGLDAYCQDIDDFDVDRLVAHTEAVLARRDELTSKLDGAVLEFGRRAAEQFDNLPWRGSRRRKY